MKIEETKTRWLRWLGQKTRFDKPYWTTLFDCNQIDWVTKTLKKHKVDCEKPSILAIFARDHIKEFYTKAIECADMQDFLRLDNLFVEAFIEKRKD